jgi:DNA-binding PadR family transcriptional regulator
VYELLVLSLLMHWPLHAYKIARMANNIIGPEEQISRGTLSSLLARLEQAGLIAPADPASVPFPSDRSSRVFAITGKGRERFFQLMLDTTSHPGFYRRLFHVKALHLDFLPLEQQLFLVEHFLQYCLKLLHEKQTEEQAFARSPTKQEHMSSPFRRRALAFMQLKVEQLQLEVAQAQSLRAQIITLMQQAGERTPLIYDSPEAPSRSSEEG